MIEIVKNILRRPIAFHRSLAEVAGSVNAGVMLSQAMYWSDRTTDPDGWFYKTSSEWQEETFLSRREQDTCRKQMKSAGFWLEKLTGVPATIHYKIDMEKLYSSLAECAKQGLHNQPNKNAQKRQTIYTETTTESTNTSESKDSDATNTFSSEGDKNSKEKEKKVAQKKKEADPCFKEMVAVWCEAYPLLGFNGASGKCINEIIIKTRQVMTGRGKEATCDALVNSFKYVIAYVKREHHFCDGKPLTTWNQQYLSIVHEIANGKVKQKPLTTREKINQL